MAILIDHIGIAVRDIQQAARLYTEGLGLRLDYIEEVPSQGVRVGSLAVGESTIELLEPLGAEGPIADFLEKRGEGIHHICLLVDDIRAAMAALQAQGARLLQEKPARGAGGSLIAFVHPRSANGVLLELCQRSEPPSTKGAET
ncbi:MAG: methylmalonyl-CoA epimerase [Chloroflexi bacterium]|nr:methylmalonyl-CoA epimerase [Chloroflexota bacterium]